MSGGGARASVFGEDGGDFDLSGFEPKPPTRAEQVREVAEQAGFRSREPASPPPVAAKREARRYRTGRNVQLNIKARAEDIEAFYALADRTGLVLGEVFARAVAALARELPDDHQKAIK